MFQSPWLRVDAANCLIEKGIAGVGIDHPGISGMEVEGVYREGKLEQLTITPESRAKDIECPAL